MLGVLRSRDYANWLRYPIGTCWWGWRSWSSRWNRLKGKLSAVQTSLHIKSNDFIFNKLHEGPTDLMGQKHSNTTDVYAGTSLTINNYLPFASVSLQVSSSPQLIICYWQRGSSIHNSCRKSLVNKSVSPDAWTDRTESLSVKAAF